MRGIGRKLIEEAAKKKNQSESRESGAASEVTRGWVPARGGLDVRFHRRLGRFQFTALPREPRVCFFGGAGRVVYAARCGAAAAAVAVVGCGPGNPGDPTGGKRPFALAPRATRVRVSGFRLPKRPSSQVPACQPSPNYEQVVRDYRHRRFTIGGDDYSYHQ